MCMHVRVRVCCAIFTLHQIEEPCEDKLSGWVCDYYKFRYKDYCTVTSASSAYFRKQCPKNCGLVCYCRP